ncbi:hypothetical protein Tco_0902730 [Tanacetum coccineum]
MHRTTSTPRSPNPDKEAAESSAPRRSTVIRLRIPKRRSTCLTPPAPVPTIDKVVEMILQDTLQVSLAEHKSHKEQEARENVALVEKMVDGQENILQGHYGYLFAHLRARFMPRKSFDTLADNLHDVMVETLPTMVDKHIKEQVMKQVLEQVWNQVPVYVAEGLILERQKAKEETERLIAKAIL